MSVNDLLPTVYFYPHLSSPPPPRSLFTSQLISYFYIHFLSVRMNHVLLNFNSFLLTFIIQTPAEVLPSFQENFVPEEVQKVTEGTTSSDCMEVSTT